MALDAATPSTMITLNAVVLSYPQLFTPRQVRGEGKPKYSASLIIDPRTQKPQLEAMHQAIIAACDKAWPKGEWKEKRKGGDMKFRWPLREGDKDRPGEMGYVGMYYVNAKSDQAPMVVDQNVQAVLDQSKIYPGLIVNALINFFPYNNMSTGVAAGLNGIQIVRDGERLGGRPDVSGFFKPIDQPGGMSLGRLTGEEDWMS